MFNNDHGLNFFLDTMPTFAVGAAAEYHNADEGWGLPLYKPFAGHPELSWHLINSLVEDEFDITTCQKMLVDHALSIPFELAWPDCEAWPVKLVPFGINTVQHPLPSAKRCLALGRAVNRALQNWQGNERIVIIGTGGLSHQLDGERAGFMNQDLSLIPISIIISALSASTPFTITLRIILIALARPTSAPTIRVLVKPAALSKASASPAAAPDSNSGTFICAG